MTRLLRNVPLALMALVLGYAPCLAQDAADLEEGFKPIFDGKTLDGWDGDPKLWTVEDGAITGTTTAEDPLTVNQFCIWRGGTPGDFVLRCEVKLEGHNTGIQYRSFEAPDAGRWVLGGYQADFEGGENYCGILYGERFRGILAQRGQKTVIGENHKPKVVEQIGEKAELQKHIRPGEWNDYEIIAKDYTFIHKINGATMIECTDEDTEMRRRDGLIGFQVHRGPPMKVQFRNIRLKRLDGEQGDADVKKK